MQIHFRKKHSNNKVRTPRKDSYPFLIQDKARASDSLNLASVRNAEDYLTEFQLVQHDTEELATGRDQEAMENYVEQIARKSRAKVVSKKAAQPVAEEDAEEAKEEEEERVGASTPQGPIVGRTEAVATVGASSTVAAEQTVAAREAVTAQGSTSSGVNEVVRTVEHTAETEEGGPRGSPAVAGDQESTAAAGATDAVREEVPSAGQTNTADEGRAGSEEDHLPLTQSLKAKAPLQPLASFLEAALERLQEGLSKDLPPCPSASHLEVLAWCQRQGTGDAPECSEEVYQEQCVDEDESVDVGALVDSVTHSLGVLKRLALWDQNHQQMWDVEFSFCKELRAQHQSREAKLKEEVKNLQDTLRTSELNLTVAQAEKEALTNILSEAKARGVTEYKAGPIFKEDLEQYGALCYKVGLGTGEDRG
ncbi:hypothetical protein Taro_031489 [Colocasia esculenta]|uniref:Uncharacterized protein n=1 Tax=Colocasia esculenta TaxID=4460 RepID=A0A843VZ67_COLES|nr:hypothetical protein [Colocasia esculenta]